MHTTDIFDPESTVPDGLPTLKTRICGKVPQPIRTPVRSSPKRPRPGAHFRRRTGRWEAPAAVTGIETLPSRPRPTGTAARMVNPSVDRWQHLPCLDPKLSARWPAC